MGHFCQVMLAGQFGGAERLFVDLCLALARRGHRVSAVCGPRSAAARMLADRAGVELHTLFAAGSWDLLARRRLRALLARLRPDLVHTHLARAAHLAGRAARPLGIPVAAMLHNYVQLKYYRDIDLFLATTADQRAYLLRAGIAPERIESVPNFSALPALNEVPANGTGLVAFGRLVPKKGFDVLLRALALLAADGLAPRLRLGGEGAERAALQAQARALGIGAQVEFAGWQEDVPRFLAGAALYVMPSLDEPFGIAALEAMACGVPMVVSATQGPREILSENEAWLVPIGDAAALARAIAAALADPAERSRRAGRALQRYRSEYSEDAVLPRLLAAYRRLAPRRSVD